MTEQDRELDEYRKSIVLSLTARGVDAATAERLLAGTRFWERARREARYVMSTYTAEQAASIVLQEPPPVQPQHIRLTEAIDRLGIGSVNTVKRWMMDGKLDGCIRGGRWFVSTQSVEDLLASGDSELQRYQAAHVRIQRLLAEDEIDLDPSDPHVREILRDLLGRDPLDDK